MVSGELKLRTLFHPSHMSQMTIPFPYFLSIVSIIINIMVKLCGQNIIRKLMTQSFFQHFNLIDAYPMYMYVHVEFFHPMKKNVDETTMLLCISHLVTLEMTSRARK